MRWTVLEIVRWTTTRFSQRGLASPRLDAEILAAHALGISRVQLYVQYDRPLEAAELAGMRELVKRRQAGESVAYIIGKKEFFGIELAVDARVLVPRPDTETLVDEALARLRSSRRRRSSDRVFERDSRTLRARAARRRRRHRLGRGRDRDRQDRRARAGGERGPRSR